MNSVMRILKATHLDLFTRLFPLLFLTLISCKVTIDAGESTTYQGVSFSLKGDNSGTEEVVNIKITGDFGEKSFFYKGEAVAVYDDDLCSNKISDDFSYDSSSQEVSGEIEVRLTKYKQHTLRIGILDSSNSLITCLKSTIGYIRIPPTPINFSLIISDENNIASIEFANIEAGIPQLQFFQILIVLKKFQKN